MYGNPEREVEEKLGKRIFEGKKDENLSSMQDKIPHIQEAQLTPIMINLNSVQIKLILTVLPVYMLFLAEWISEFPTTLTSSDFYFLNTQNFFLT